MHISGLDLAQLIASYTPVGLSVDLLLVITRLERREDQVAIVHNLKKEDSLKMPQTTKIR